MELFKDEIYRAIQSIGIVEQLVLDGKVHKFSTHTKPRKKNAWYVGSFDSIYRYCVIGNFETGEKITLYPENKGEMILDAKTYQQIEDQKRNLEVQIKTRQEKCASRSQRIWASMSASGSSEYLKRKQAIPINIKYGCGLIALPIVDFSGKIWGLQKIYDNGDKKFSSGVNKRGNFGIIGCEINNLVSLNNFNYIYVAEGYATANSIYQATNIPVVIAFDCYNLMSVVENLRKNLFNTQIIICADNDAYKFENIGINKAKEIVDKIDNTIFKSPTFKDISTKPTDFNDLAVLSGLSEVKEQLTSTELIEQPSRFLINSNKYILNDIDNIIYSSLYEYDKNELSCYCRPNIPKILLNPPKHIKMILDYVLEKSFYPQPILYIVNIIVAIGVVLGKRIRNKDNARTNIYAIGLCESGCGKDASLKAIEEIFTSIGLDDLIFSGACSDSAIFKHLADNEGRALGHIDEFGDFLRAIKVSNSSWEKKVTTLLTKLYSSASSSSFKEATKKTEESVKVMQPLVGIYGVTNQFTLYDTITSKDALDGFLNRFILVEGLPHREEYKKSNRIQQVPENIIRYFSDLNNIPTNSDEISRVGMNLPTNIEVSTSLGGEIAKPIVMNSCGSAAIMLENYRKFCDEKFVYYSQQQSERANNLAKMSVYSRSYEKACKLALICSLENPNNIHNFSYTVEAVRYAIALAHYSDILMLDLIDDHIADTPAEVKCKKILTYLKSCGCKISTISLVREFGMKFGNKDFEDTINLLIKAGKIKRVTNDEGNFIELEDY